jgi:hypothetical protein
MFDDTRAKRTMFFFCGVKLLLFLLVFSLRDLLRVNVAPAQSDAVRALF